MKKISKKEGQTRLMNNISKMVCMANGDTERIATLINNTPMENYIKCTENVPTRQGIKFNNNEVVFQILEGENKGQHSWLSSLTGSKWYEFTSKLDKNYVIIHFINGDWEQCMAYELIK